MFKSLAFGVATNLSIALASVAQEGLPAATYELDPTHSSVIFRVQHLGLSNFTASFDQVSAMLEIDPENPADAHLRAVIEAASLDLPSPPPEFLNEMLGPTWFDAATHPEIVFVSDRVVPGPDNTATVEGTLTLRGVSRPVSLDVRFNTGFPPGIIEPHARIGFSAETLLSRSDYGMSFGVPAPGSTFGVGDEIEVLIQAEFIQVMN